MNLEVGTSTLHMCVAYCHSQDYNTPSSSQTEETDESIEVVTSTLYMCVAYCNIKVYNTPSP